MKTDPFPGESASMPCHRASVAAHHDEPEETGAARRRASGMRRAPSRAVVWSEADSSSLPAKADTSAAAPLATFTTRTEVSAGGVVLHLSGALDMASLLRLRDVAFTIIGTRPATLCLDLRLVSRIEFAGIEALIAIARVARLSQIRFTVRASAVFARHLRETGIARTLTLESPPEASENPCPGK